MALVSNICVASIFHNICLRMKLHIGKQRGILLWHTNCNRCPAVQAGKALSNIVRKESLFGLSSVEKVRDL